MDLSTGQMAHSIPLYNIQVGDYSFPVTLGYSYNGFVLEGKPSLSGLGWTLNNTGVVTREVRGLPDEHPYGYYGVSSIRSELETYESNQTMNMQTALDIIEGTYDAEPDKYVVGVNGINFSFKIDVNKDAVFLSEHNYQVDLHWDLLKPTFLESIDVIDDQGNKYIFGKALLGDDNWELNSSCSVCNDDAGNGPMFENYRSSWMLSKIILNNGREINFSYTDNYYHTVDFSATASFQDKDCQGRVGYSYSERWIKTDIDRKILTEITYDLGKVIFNVVTNETGTTQEREVYDRMEVLDFDNNSILKYDFSYSGNRDLLDEIEKNDEPYYTFDYLGSPGPFYMTNNADSPQPLRQDLWGFFNGANNQYAINIPGFGSEYTANKKPSFHHAKIGALEKINYPTGGYTKVVYEPNRVKNEEGYVADINEIPGFNRMIQIRTNGTENYFEYTFERDVVALISYSVTRGSSMFSPQARITRNTQSSGNCPVPSISEAPQFPEAAQYYRNNNEEPRFCPYLQKGFHDGITGSSGDIIDGNSGGYIIIPAGTYEFGFHNVHSPSTGSGEIIVQFYDPPSEIDTQFSNKITGGIRVKKLQNYDKGGVLTQTMYNYNDEDGYSTGVEFQKPLIQYSYDGQVCCDFGSELSFRSFHRTMYAQGSFNPLNLNRGVPVFYTSVRKYNQVIENPIQVDSGFDSTDYQNQLGLSTNSDGTFIVTQPNCTECYTKIEESYPSGYTQTDIETPRFYLDTTYPYVPYGVDKDMGRVLEERMYKTVGSQNYEHIATSASTYEEITKLTVGQTYDSDALHPVGIKMGYILKVEDNYGCEVWGIPDPHDYFDFKLYKEVDRNYYPSLKTTTTYYPNPMVAQESFVYDPNTNKLKEKTSTGSDDEDVQNKFYYAENFPAEYDDLIQQNKIGSPVLVETYKNGELLSTTKTLYKDWGVSQPDPPIYNTHLIFPEYVKTAKGSPVSLENRLVYVDYDDKGNVIEAKLEDGSPVSYVWGYNGQLPVAKVEGKTYSQLPSIVNQIMTETNEATLLTHLGQLRDNLGTGAMVTTYTYKPLIGISTTTDPKGLTSYFKYDSQNRLEYILDKDGKVLKKYSYNYRKDRTLGDGGPIEATLSMSHTLSNGEVTFDLNTTILGGSNNPANWTYTWYYKIGNGPFESITHTQPNLLNYTIPGGAGAVCSQEVTFKVEINCMTDNGYEYEQVDLIQDNIVDCPFSTGDLIVNLMGQNGSTMSYQGYVDNLIGGGNNLQFHWSYKLISNDHYIPIATTSTNLFNFDAVGMCCNEIRFRCHITNIPGEPNSYVLDTDYETVSCQFEPITGGNLIETHTVDNNVYTFNLYLLDLQGGDQGLIFYKFYYQLNNDGVWHLIGNMGNYNSTQYIEDGCCNTIKFKCDIFDFCVDPDLSIPEITRYTGSTAIECNGVPCN
ncbi:MAG: hypothetical protein Aureis2KO_31990 [Aureisphaera sp.]